MNNTNPLYKEELMEIYKNPPHKGSMEKPDVEVLEKNPLCGDEIYLQLKVEDGKITDAKFRGAACAVSIVASANLLDEVIGKTLEEAKNITKEDLLKIVDLNLTTSRVKCATLVLSALTKAIEKYEQENK